MAVLFLLLTVDRFGRRAVLLFSTILTGVSSLLLLALMQRKERAAGWAGGKGHQFPGGGLILLDGPAVVLAGPCKGASLIPDLHCGLVQTESDRCSLARLLESPAEVFVAGAFSLLRSRGED